MARKKAPELTFQQHIADSLIRVHGYPVLEQAEITDPEQCIAEDHLWAFLNATQPDQLKTLKDDYGTDARDEVFRTLRLELTRTQLWMILRHGLTVRGCRSIHKNEIRPSFSAPISCAGSRRRRAGAVRPGEPTADRRQPRLAAGRAAARLVSAPQSDDRRAAGGSTNCLDAAPAPAGPPPRVRREQSVDDETGAARGSKRQAGGDISHRPDRHGRRRDEGLPGAGVDRAQERCNCPARSHTACLPAVRRIGNCVVAPPHARPFHP